MNHTKIYTKTGDNGLTSILGGMREKKVSVRIEALGTLDEVNCLLGVALNKLSSNEVKLITDIQDQLLELGALLAHPGPIDSKSFWDAKTRQLEQKIDYYEDKLPALSNFILPGGQRGAAQLHLARAVMRRAERRILMLDNVPPSVRAYVNRLSDLFFVLARWTNHQAGHSETVWRGQDT